MLLIILPISAHAQATVSKSSFPFSLSFPDTNPCTGKAVTIGIVGEAQVQSVTDSSGKLHHTFLLRADLTETDLGTGQVSSGSIEWNRSFDSDQETFVINGRITQAGANNNVVIHLLTHASPNGVSFDKGNTECR
jgi:hypothetical protein